MPLMIDAALLPLLRCPATGQPLTPVAAVEFKGRKADGAEAYLVRQDGGVAYPVRRGIPLLLVEEGIPVSE